MQKQAAVGWCQPNTGAGDRRATVGSSNASSWEYKIMARDLNKVQLIGRLGTEPEAKYTPQGSLIVSFRVATGRTDTDGAGNQREDTEWTNIVCWQKLAELAQEYLRKGARVYIEGRLQTRTWDNEQTGQKQYWTEVVANDIIFLDRRQDVPAVESEEELASAAPPARGGQPRARMATTTPTTSADDGVDDLPF
jgi:single-strand DNA-binding protein